MHWRDWPDAAQFLAVARPVLAADPLPNQLVLGVATALAAGRAFGAGAPVLVTLHEGERCVGAAVHTPPRAPLVSDLSPAAAACAAARLCASGAVTGVTGPLGAAAAFAAAAAGGAPVRTESDLGLYELTHVRAPPPGPGALRPATEADAALLQAWACAFRDEATPHDPPPAPDEGERLVATGRSRLWVDQGEPVAWSHSARELDGGYASIGPVYTPPARRGRGYATRLVAAHSAALLREGRRGCTLFTDLANPTSNAIYERIGYRRVGEMRRLGWG